MIQVRNVFQAKYGRGGELVALFKEAAKQWPEEFAGTRILTDAAGQFFTVVTEAEVPSLADFERRAKETFARPEFGDWFARMMPLVDSGRREFWNIET